VAAGCRHGSVVVETSTVSPAASRRAADAVAEAGGTLLRAAVSGNPVLVRAATITFLCSGERAAYERCGPLFELLGKAAFHLGEGEEARYAKLAVNLMVAGSMQLMAETLGLAEAAGLDRRTMLEVLGSSAIGSPFVAYKTDPLVEGDYSPTFSVDGLRKDLRLVLDAAGDLRVPLALTGVVDQLLAACQGMGWGDLDLAALVLLEQRLRGADDDLSR
jgi:3-hydroxyisobutyrate dehydrogenase-like beta-hydroxyacid dehydrogenase